MYLNKAVPLRPGTTIERPARYLGGEYNSRRPRDDADFRICLVFPDLYEIGISYYGYQILYHLFNQIEGVACERAYLPWQDMQKELVSRHLHLCSLESSTPLKDFDAIGITLQTELHYPGVLKILDLAGIPRQAVDRRMAYNQSGKRYPIILGGGPCAFHPEPVAPFFDAFLIGDGEEAVPELTELMRCRDFKKSSCIDKWHALAQIDGVYVPGLYRQDHTDPRRMLPDSGARARIRARTVVELKSGYYPDHPVVPAIRGTHDRLTVEIMRGCTQGCRFCQAGMLHRPVRERPVLEIVDQIVSSLAITGWDEVGLLSLSTSDYSQLSPLLQILAERFAEKGEISGGMRATLAFPSLRPSSFTEEIAAIDTGGKKNSLTFAIEAGSERLRGVINKAVSEEELFDAVDRAYRHGWNAVKLYFMIGLPTESGSDIEEGANLLHRLARKVPRGREIRFSVSPFIPKPHSVFAGEGYGDIDQLNQKQRELYRSLRGRWIKTSWRDPQESMIETVLARADRRLAPVIADIADKGSGFEGWGGEFSAAKWIESLNRLLPDWHDLLKPLVDGEPRAWDHISKGITDHFVKNDLTRARDAIRLDDCRSGECPKCGLSGICDHLMPITEEKFSLSETHKKLSASEATKSYHWYRLTFSKLGKARYLGHHDLMSVVERSLRRLGLEMSYSEGFNPRPRIRYGPAISLGIGMAETWVEFESVKIPDLVETVKYSRQFFPHGIKPWNLTEITSKGSTEPGESRSFKLRFNTPVQISADGDYSRDEEGGVVSWSINPGGRTIYVTLKRTGKKNRFPRPEDALGILSESRGQIWDLEHVPELLSVTLLEA